MAKGTKEIGEPTSGTPTSSLGELREMMQNMIAEIGDLAGKILSLKNWIKQYLN